MKLLLETAPHTARESNAEGQLPIHMLFLKNQYHVNELAEVLIAGRAGHAADGRT